MAANRIRDMRIKAGLTQGDVADKLQDANRVVMSFIESGKVLPNARMMKELCALLQCSPSDLYSSNDLKLESPQQQDRINRRGRGHEGMTEFRVWITPEEKDALEASVSKMGYRNSAEWFREALRTLIQKCVQLRLAESESILNVRDDSPIQGA